MTTSSPCEVLTFTGKRVNLLDPDPRAIDIMDIAVGLANQTRFNGQAPGYSYQVAQHCVWGSHQFEDPEMALRFLLHDAHEAYTGDIVRPMRTAIGCWLEHNRGLDPYIGDPTPAITSGIDCAVCRKVGLPTPLVERQVAVLDDDLCRVEFVRGWPSHQGLVDVLPEWASSYPEPWSVSRCRVAFLERFAELQKARGRND